MSGNSTPPFGKRAARYRMTLTVRTVEALQPEEKSYTASDDKLTGFGVRVQPSGLRSYLVNYRAGGRGQKATGRKPSFSSALPNSMSLTSRNRQRESKWLNQAQHMKNLWQDFTALS